MPRSLVLALAAAIALAACKRGADASAGAPCDAVGGHFVTVARAELAARKDLDKDLAAGVDGLIAPMRDALVRACKDGAWGADARDCFVGARDERAMKACYVDLTPAQRAALDKASAGAAPDAP